MVTRGWICPGFDTLLPFDYLVTVRSGIEVSDQERGYYHIAAFWTNREKRVGFRRYGPVTPQAAEMEGVDVLATVDGPFPGPDLFSTAMDRGLREVVNRIDGRHMQLPGEGFA